MNKTFEVQCRAEAGCLRAHVTGWVDTYEATLAFFRKIAVELRKVDVRRVLIVDETRGVVPTPDELERLALALKGEGFDGKRNAYVDVAATAIARIEAGEIRARAHGYRFRVFDNEHLARIWLRYGRE